MSNNFSAESVHKTFAFYFFMYNNNNNSNNNSDFINVSSKTLQVVVH